MRKRKKRWVIEGDALDLLNTIDKIDLVCTDPPYAFGGSGDEHAISATVAIVLRETAKKLKQGSWFIVFSASSWRSISYMVESVRSILMPVRIATWTKPETKTKVRTIGWSWNSVSVIAMRKGPKNRSDLPDPSQLPDHKTAPIVTKERRAQLPIEIAEWAILPFIIQKGIFLDPFSGSGTLPHTAERLGMLAYGFEKNPIKQSEKTQ